ncbi:MAG TPA: DUF2510 domain-containing protein [Acidimicrobiales bacterium]|nr:DUF2510 domain-containing protein [Acidimicrobiales bacterium]
MATASDGSRQFRGEYAHVFDVVCAAAEAERMHVRFTDPVNGVISVSSEMTAFSWGENADIRVWPTGDGLVGVAIGSKLKFGLVDWGKNKRNVERLFGRIDAFLLDPPPPRPPPPGGWYPDPHRRHESRYWDGAAWTEHVADAGVSGTDPA